MAFNPDAFLAKKRPAFDPDAFLALNNEPGERKLTADDLGNISPPGMGQEFTPEQIAATKIDERPKVVKAAVKGAAELALGINRIPAAVGSVVTLPGNIAAGAMGRPDWQNPVPQSFIDNPNTRYYEDVIARNELPELNADTLDTIRQGNYEQAGKELALKFIEGAPTNLAVLGAALMGPVSGAVGLAGMGAVAGGQQVKQAKASGVSPAMVGVDVGVTGAAESLSELYGSFGIFKKWEKELAKQFGKKATRAVIAATAKTMVASTIGEGTEEATNSIAQDITDYATGVNPRALEGMAGRAANAGLVGATSGGLMTTPGAVMTGYARATEQDGGQPSTVKLSPNLPPTAFERAKTMATTDPIAALKSIAPVSEYNRIDAIGQAVASAVEADETVPAEQKQVISAQVLNSILEGSIAPVAPVAAPEQAQEPAKEEPGAAPDLETQVEVLEKAAELNGVTGADIEAVFPDTATGMRALADIVKAGTAQGLTTDQMAEEMAQALQSQAPVSVSKPMAEMTKEQAVEEIQSLPTEEKATIPEAALQYEAEIAANPVSEEPTFKQAYVPPVPVSDVVTAQLQDVGYSEPEAKANAVLINAFYEAEANKRGISVQEYTKENPLPGVATEGEGELQQPPGKYKGPLPDWGEEFESNGHRIYSDGTILVYHGTTKEKGAQILKEGILRRPADAPDSYGVHFSTSKEISDNYGDGTVIAMRVPIRNLQFEDVFPNGRMDFMVKTKDGIFKPAQIGSYNDNPDIFLQPAYHGSPFTFDKFTLDHIGKGEGAQAYGYGLYFAGDKAVAEYYRGQLSKKEITYKGEPVKFDGPITPDNDAIRAVAGFLLLEKNPEKAIKEYLNSTPDDVPIKGEIVKLNPKDFSVNEGKLYEVNIPEDDTLLDWDKPLNEQTEAVKNGVKNVFDQITNQEKDWKKASVLSREFESLPSDITGEELYKKISDILANTPIADPARTTVMTGEEKASLALDKSGIQGIKYLDGSSRDKGKGHHNYVIFDDKAIEILNRYYQDARGFYSQGKNLIGLLKDKDQSTFAHESAHAWLTDIWRFVKSGKADEAYKAHWEPMAKWLGVTEGQTAITREQQEKFAAGFEAYLREGKAPSTGLTRVFQQFRAWLLNIYKSAKQIKAELSDEARGFYSRLLESQKADVESVVNQAKEAQAKGELTLMQEPVKRTVNKSTGVKPIDKEVITTQMKLLKMNMASAQRAARQAARVTKAAILEDIRVKRGGEKEIRAAVSTYVKANLPPDQRGRFLTMVEKAVTTTDLAKAVLKVDNANADVYRKAIVDDIKKVANRALESKRVDVEYREAAKELLANIDFVKRRPDTILRLKAMREYIDRLEDSGRAEFVPDHIFKRLEILTLRPVSAISEEELNLVLRDLLIIESVGKEAQATKELAEGIDKGVWLRALTEKQVKHINLAEDAGKIQKTWAKAQEIYWALAPMVIVMDRLDGGKGTYDGAHAHMFQALNGDFKKYLILKRENIQPVMEIIEKHGLNEASMERIGIYALKVQVNGPARVLASMPDMTEESIKALTLNANEMEVYQAMRAAMEALYPATKRLMGKLYNKSMGSVDNYFSFQTDWEKLSEMEVMERLSRTADDFTGTRKNITAGFTKERVKGAQVPIQVNALKVFLQHINDAAYFVAMQENVKKFQEITSMEGYAEAVGPQGHRIVKSWLDLLARQGKAEGSKKIPWLDWLRKNVGASTMGFKLSTFLIQNSSFLDAASLVGGVNVLDGMATVATNKEARTWLMVSLPKLRERVGDDLSFSELSDAEWLKVWQKRGYAPMQIMDKLVASSAVMAAVIKKSKEMGLTVDYSKPMPAAVVEYADYVLSKTQASPFFFDTGVAFNSSKAIPGINNVSVNKSILQYKQFSINRWFYMSYDVPRLKTAGEKIQAGVYLAAATMAEMGIRGASQATTLAILGAFGVGIAAAVKGARDDDDEWKDYALQLLGNIPFMDVPLAAIRYGSVPIPVLGKTADLFINAGAAANAQSEYRKAVALRKSLVALASLAGIPGTAQIGQIWAWTYNPKTLTFPYNAEYGKLQDIGGARTYGEESRLSDLEMSKREFSRYAKVYRDAMEKGDIVTAATAAQGAAQALEPL